MIYAFDGFELDTDLYELRRDGVDLALEPQVFDVLLHLLGHRDRVVSKEELLDEVWGDRFVSESTLTSRIRDARRAIGDDGKSQRAIKTIHGRGFRFVAVVREMATEARPVVPARRRQDVVAEDAPAQSVRFCTSSDGVRLAYATVGTGPPLVKAANWLTHLRHDWESIVWRHWLRDLSSRFQLIHYDCRASGMSDWTVDEVSFDAWVRDLEAVVDANNLERFPLLGVSQGGAVAVAYAAAHPERVSHLILYGSFPRGRGRSARTDRERQEAAMMLDVIETGWGQERSTLRQIFPAQFMPEATTEQWDAFEAHQRLTASPENAWRLQSVSSELDVTDIAPLVRTPTLVLHAHDDRRVSLESGELMAALIPGARFVRLHSSNHILLDSEPAWSEFLTAIDDFTAS